MKIILKRGNEYISGCYGDDDGNLFPTFTEDRKKAMRFESRKEFRDWADELTEPDKSGWFEYKSFQTIAAS